VCGLTIYPNDYFNPFDDITGRLVITDNTRSIHWYSKTWVGKSSIGLNLSRLVHRILDQRLFVSLRYFVSFIKKWLVRW